MTPAYCAGFFDGEGSVYAASRGGRAASSNRRPSPTITVCISNTNLAVLQAHQQKYGGSLPVSGKRKVSDRHRIVYQWVLSAKQAKPYLLDIRPHLIVKTEVVDVALEYVALQELPYSERRDSSPRTFSHGRWWCAPTLREDYRIKVQEIWLRIRELNARGAPFNATRKNTVYDEIIRNTQSIVQEGSSH